MNEYDDYGNLIHYFDDDGVEWFWQYDSKGNEIHYKNSLGFEEWILYDFDGKVVEHFTRGNLDE